MGYIPHLVTLALCLTAIVLAAKNMIQAPKLLRPDAMLGLVILLCFFQIGTVTTFMIVQFGWVLKGHDALVGVSAQLGWLAYDYQNKLFHISSALLLGHWLKCRRVNDGKRLG